MVYAKYQAYSREKESCKKSRYAYVHYDMWKNNYSIIRALKHQTQELMHEL